MSRFCDFFLIFFFHSFFYVWIGIIFCGWFCHLNVQLFILIFFLSFVVDIFCKLVRRLLESAIVTKTLSQHDCVGIELTLVFSYCNFIWWWRWCWFWCWSLLFHFIVFLYEYFESNQSINSREFDLRRVRIFSFQSMVVRVRRIHSFIRIF